MNKCRNAVWCYIPFRIISKPLVSHNRMKLIGVYLLQSGAQTARMIIK